MQYPFVGDWGKQGQPHFSHDLIGVVHNGIIENYAELKQELEQIGYHFESQTDTEVIVHLIHSYILKTKIYWKR